MYGCKSKHASRLGHPRPASVASKKEHSMIPSSRGMKGMGTMWKTPSWPLALAVTAVAVQGCHNASSYTGSIDSSTDTGTDGPDGTVSCTIDDDCEDGNACNGTATCLDGTCVVDPESVVTCAPTSTRCHVLTCVPETGVCVDHNPVEGTACEDDSNACTEDECDGEGACTHLPLGCDDGNECTDDSCDPSSGCAYTDNTDMCDDSDPCTHPDVCRGGICTSTELESWYLDGDNDGYGDPLQSTCASEIPAGHVANDDDCCDSHPGVNPAQTSYFAVAYPCGVIDSFDYDCDTVEEMRQTAIGSCAWDSSTGTCVLTQGWRVASGSGPVPCGVPGDWISACLTGGPGVCAEAIATGQTQECR